MVERYLQVEICFRLLLPPPWVLRSHYFLPFLWWVIDYLH
jgi:hypothetical protein